MDQNNTTQTPVAPTPETPAATPSATPAAGATQGVVASPKKPGMGGKKNMIMILLLLVILVVLGALGYYYYANMMKKPEMTVVAPTVQPTPIAEEASGQIQDESELDGIVTELDSSTDEANMTQEASSLQSDSNF